MTDHTITVAYPGIEFGGSTVRCRTAVETPHRIAGRGPCMTPLVRPYGDTDRDYVHWTDSAADGRPWMSHTVRNRANGRTIVPAAAADCPLTDCDGRSHVR